MPTRHVAVTLLALALTTSASCSKIFPAAEKGTKVTSLKPRIAKTTAQRRPGSDVTLPAKDPNSLIGALIPCDPADSAAAKPRIVTDCQLVDPKGDMLRPPVDTTARKAP